MQNIILSKNELVSLPYMTFHEKSTTAELVETPNGNKDFPVIKGDTTIKPKDDYLEPQKFDYVKLDPLPYSIDGLEPHIPKEVLSHLYNE